MPQTKSVFFYDFLRTLTGQYIFGRRKNSISSLWSCVRRLKFRCSRCVSFTGSASWSDRNDHHHHPHCYYRHSGATWVPYFHPKRAPGNALTLLPPLPSSTKAKNRKERKRRKKKKGKKRNEPPLNPPLQAASEPLHIWMLLISKYILSICGPLSNPPQIPEVALTGP